MVSPKIDYGLVRCERPRKDAKTCGCGAAGFCVWRSILFSFRRRFLFGDGKAEGADLFTKLEIFAVCKGGKSRLVEA